MSGENIDPAEVTRYNELAKTWWNADGPMWPLHKLNELRAPWVCQRICEQFGRDPHAEQPLQGLRLLDIGCAGGLLSESMARLGAQVTGIDVAARNIQIARQHAEGQNLPVCYQHTEVEGLTEGDWDVVLNMEVVEHVPDVERFMDACNARVAPGGMTVLATINRTWLAWVVAILGAEFVFRMLPKGTHQWSRFVTPHELEAALYRGGLRPSNRTGVRVNPFRRRLSLSRGLSVNYMMSAARERS